MIGCPREFTEAAAAHGSSRKRRLPMGVHGIVGCPREFTEAAAAHGSSWNRLLPTAVNGIFDRSLIGEEDGLGGVGVGGSFI